MNVQQVLLYMAERYRVTPIAKNLSALMADSSQNHKTTMALVLVFGAIALALVAVGIYGILSASVKQRTSECGIRLALGARPSDLIRLIISEGLSISDWKG